MLSLIHSLIHSLVNVCYLPSLTRSYFHPHSLIHSLIYTFPSPFLSYSDLHTFISLSFTPSLIYTLLFLSHSLPHSLAYTFPSLTHSLTSVSKSFLNYEANNTQSKPLHNYNAPGYPQKQPSIFYSHAGFGTSDVN